MTLKQAEIPNPLKTFFSNDEECKEIKKSGVFTKTFRVLTDKRLMVIKKGSKLSEASFVSKNEENVSLTKDLTLISSKRLIALSVRKENNFEIAFDATYVEDKEMYISHKLNTTLWLPDLEPPSYEINAAFLILTNNRLLLYSDRYKELKFLKSIDLGNIEAVDMLRTTMLSQDYCCIKIKTKDGKPSSAIKHELANREKAEVFPRKIAEAAGVCFAPPIINSIEGSNTFVEFYPKENIQFPNKCSKCGKVDGKVENRKLKLEKTILIEKPPLIGLDSVSFNVPYCPDCYIGKAVKKNSFDGVRAILEFKNNDYANEFIELNSK